MLFYLHLPCTSIYSLVLTYYCVLEWQHTVYFNALFMLQPFRTSLLLLIDMTMHVWPTLRNNIFSFHSVTAVFIIHSETKLEEIVECDRLGSQSNFRSLSHLVMLLPIVEEMSEALFIFQETTSWHCVSSHFNYLPNWPNPAFIRGVCCFK